MVLTLKVVWTSDCGESEIRRLTVHEDVINRYNLLADKVVKLFPQLTGQCFHLGWKDSEGDFIVMSSDEELAQAVANAVENGLIKIYVSTKTGKNTEGRPKSSAVHPSVVCDGCNSSVCGYRYKCLECLDYDLCEKCHQEDKHPGHDMLKICTPVGEAHNWMFPGWRRMYRSMFGRHPLGPRCSSGKRFGPKHGEATDKKEKGSGTASSSPHAEFLKNIGKSVAFFLDPLGIDVDVMVSENSDTDASGDSKKGAESQTQVEEKEPTNTSDERMDFCEESQTVDKNGAPEAKDEEVLVMTAPQNDSTSADTSAQGVRPKNYGLFQDYSCTDKAENKESSPESCNGQDDWTVITNVPAAKDDKKDEDKVKNDVEIIGLSAPAAKVSYPELPEDDVNIIGIQAPVARAPYPQLVNEVNLIGHLAQAAKVSCPEFSEGKMPFDVGAQNSLPTHYDPKIANALSKMCAMGFTNEGGWLTRLLETKNGNINDVLDALYPNRH